MAALSCDTAAAPQDVAEGPGGCDDPDAQVLAAEQAEYERCWHLAYERSNDSAPCSG